MSRISASSRLRRVLAVLPWIIAQPGGAPIDEVCRRFGISRAQLMADLDIVWMVALYPYTPDRMIDVVVEGDRVSIRLAEYFSRPLRLTPDEALAMVATGRTLAAVPGADPAGPLARGVAKLAAALGVDASQVQVDLGDVAASTLTLLQQAVDEHRQVEVDYYAFGRDERSTRRLDPHRVHVDQGQWYLVAHDHERDDARVFRVDRIEGIRLLDEPSAPPPTAVDLAVFSPGPDTPRVVLDLAPAARWVLEQYPVEAIEALDGGRVRATLAVSGTPWLERLLLRLGPDVVVVGPPDLADVGPAAAARLLGRYGGAAPS